MIQSSHWNPFVNLARTYERKNTDSHESVNIAATVTTRASPLLSVGAFGSWAAMIDRILSGA